MARRVARGEIWIIDLGMAAKLRPCVILSVPLRDDEKAVVTYVARTIRVSGGPV
jgi:mRNA interferase MazF